MITAHWKGSGEGVGSAISQQRLLRVPLCTPCFVCWRCVSELGKRNQSNPSNKTLLVSACWSAPLDFLKNTLLSGDVLGSCNIPSSSHRHQPGTETPFLMKAKSGGRNMPEPQPGWKSEPDKEQDPGGGWGCGNVHSRAGLESSSQIRPQ